MKSKSTKKKAKETEKIDKVTGQKESEIPVFKENFPKTQDTYFVLTRLIFNNSYSRNEVIGIYTDGIYARSAMDKAILDEGFLPSNIISGSPTCVSIGGEKYNSESINESINEIIEYKIWKTKVTF